MNWKETVKQDLSPRGMNPNGDFLLRFERRNYSNLLPRGMISVGNWRKKMFFLLMGDNLFGEMTRPYLFFFFSFFSSFFFSSFFSSFSSFFWDRYILNK